MKKWVVLDGLVLSKRNAFLELVRWRTIEFISEFLGVLLKILPILSSVDSMKYAENICKIWQFQLVKCTYQSII